MNSLYQGSRKLIRQSKAYVIKDVLQKTFWITSCGHWTLLIVAVVGSIYERPPLFRGCTVLNCFLDTFLCYIIGVFYLNIIRVVLFTRGLGYCNMPLWLFIFLRWQLQKSYISLYVFDNTGCCFLFAKITWFSNLGLRLFGYLYCLIIVSSQSKTLFIWLEQSCSVHFCLCVHVNVNVFFAVHRD